MRILTRRFFVSLMVMMAMAASGLPGALSPVRAAGSMTALAIDSEPGDYVGAGQQLEYAPPTATFGLHSDAAGGVFLQVFGPNGGDFWNLSLTAPGSAPLAVGTYESAQRSADATHPGLDVGGQGRGCNQTAGRFVVREVAHGSTGNVTAIAASFEQHCDGGPALFGELRYQATAGYGLLSVAPTSVDLGSAGIGSATAPQTVHLTSTGTEGIAITGLSIEGSDATDFRIASDTCPDGGLPPAASCDVVLAATPSATGSRAAQLAIDNDTFRGRRTVGILATGVTPVSAVAWATMRSGPRYSFDLGQSLARTVKGTTAYLHATYTTDRVSGKWVTDKGPRAGVYYVRTGNNGLRFSTPKRLNPTTQHGSRGSIASSGKYLYATWVSTSRWVAYRGTAPRVLYLRRNSNHGAGASWNTTKRLTSLSGRVDFPTVAAAGANVYVVYTDSRTGSVKLKVSRNRGTTWGTVTLGSTAWSTTSGRLGVPRIAASANTVVVSWLSNSSGAVKARVSTDAGRTWSATGALTGASTDLPAVAALGSRAAVAWTDGSSAVVRTWIAGTWSEPMSTGAPTGAAYTRTYGPAIALGGTTGIGVAWTGCVTRCTTWTSATRADLIWSESTDGGASWFAGQVIGSSSGSAARRYNDYPSVLWPSATTRHVLWNAGTARTNHYRIVLRTGTGLVAASSATAAVTKANPIAGEPGTVSATPLRSPGGR